MNASSVRKSMVEELGWEGTWSFTSLLLLCLVQYVPALNAIAMLKSIAGWNGFACGGVLATLYFLEIDGRVWLGGIIPIAFASWGLTFIW
jgi:hypothetical protein